MIQRRPRGESVSIVDTERHHFVTTCREPEVLNMGKKEQAEESLNSNAWLTTYTDLMTLLLTFFVLLISISTVDQNRKREALNSLIGAFGFKPGAQSVLGNEKGLNVTLGAAPMVKEKVDFSQLENVAFKNGLNAQVQVRQEKERIIITLSKRVLFERGSTRIKPESVKFLREVGNVLKEVPGLIELRGFADETEVIFDPDPMKRAMYLSTERVMAVYGFFKDESRIPMRKMVAHGFGYRTGKHEVDPDQKARDNQVEIICNYRGKIPYHLRRKPENTNILLNFKGFLFKLRGEKDGER
jgi:chemotaxis protein MotB